MEIKNRFGVFIAKLRKEKGISLEQLSDGLCTPGMLSRFERGEREPEKLMQNRFLTRLGTVPENYENFLGYKEYCRWEKRQGILHHILEENMEQANVLLEEYRQTYKMNYSLEKQFYLAMLAQVRRYEGASGEELASLFEEALQLTVPKINSHSFLKRVLSLEEMNLLLEYRFYCCQGVTLQFYETLLEYIEKMERTTLALAKIYPKTVFYYYTKWKQEENPEYASAEHMVQLCDKAIEILRNANRMFYLWELFCMREELMQKLPGTISGSEEFIQRQKDCFNWKETLEELYSEYGISIAMYEFCYLYVESENYCIGDVIRIRRKMLGLSQEKLCKGICDSRTVSRLERNLRRPQKEIVQQLFERLNLSTELCRTELVTDSQEAIEKYREVKIQSNNGNYKKVESLIEELKKIVSLENSSNIQVLLRNEILNNYGQGKYSQEEYIEMMKKVLGYTVSYDAVINSDEKYLTNAEIACVQNILLEVDWNSCEMQECITALTNLCERLRFPNNYARMYEFIMIIVSNELGDKGEYGQSTRINHELINMSLKNRRLKAIDGLLYGIIWNEQQKSKVCRDRMKDASEELKRCVRICDLAKKTNNKKFYEKKMGKACD